MVRAWFEGLPPALRAHVSMTVDVTSNGYRSAYAGHRDEVLRLVADWLDELAADAEADGPLS